MGADDLFLSPSDLGAFYQSAQQSDPFGLTGRALTSFQPDMSTWSPQTAGITSFAKAFLGGLLQNYGRQQASRQLMSVASVLPQLQKDPMAVAAPEGVNSDAFQLLRGTAILKNAQREEALKAQGQSSLAELLKAIVPQAVTSGQMSASDGLRALQTGKLPETPTLDPAKNPNSPQYKLNKDAFELEQKFTNTLLTGAEGQKAMGMNKAALNIMEALKKNSPLAASTAIFEYAKLQDPTGTVREGDEMRVSDPGGPLGYLSRLHNQITGTGKLTPQAKQQMMELVPKLQANQFAVYGQLKDSLLESAKEYGADPTRIKFVEPADLAPYLSTSAVSPAAELLQIRDALKAGVSGLERQQLLQRVQEIQSSFTDASSGVPLG